MIHNCSASNLILGERLASAALYELYGKGRHYKAPEPERIREVEPGKLEVVFSHVTHWLNPYEVPADELPLTVEDEQGVVAITEYACDKDTITLTLARPLAGRAALSGAHQTNPPALILCDCATLPMLSFYQMEIEK